MIDHRLMIGGVAFVAGLLIAGTAQGWRYGEKISKMEADQAKAISAAVGKAREEEQHRINKLEKVANETRSQLEAAHVDAAAARRSSDGLRKQLADYRTRTRCDSAVAGGSPSAEDPLFLLSDLLSRADERAGDLAEFADRSHIAGRACETAYDSLRTAQ